MFSQTPERQASVSSGQSPRERRKATSAKGFTEVGKTVIEQLPPSVAEPPEPPSPTESIEPESSDTDTLDETV